MTTTPSYHFAIERDAPLRLQLCRQQMLFALTVQGRHSFAKPA
jgi:hypothetical protein